MKLVVLDGYAMNPGDLSWEKFRALGDVEIYDRTPPEQVVPRIKNARIVITNKARMSREVLFACPNLKYVGITATGYDNIDHAAARERGITVTYVPAYSTDSVAQFIFALLLEICHSTKAHADAVASGAWARCPDYTFHLSPLIELRGKTIGFIGMGRIGTKAAEIAQAFGMNVICYHSSARKDGVTHVSLDALLEQSDVISLCCPVNEQTRHIINRRTLEKMKRGVILINTARGALIEEEALADFLKSRHVYAAGLDVLKEEPPVRPSPLIGLDNCIITPHIAWASFAARQRLFDAVYDNVVRFLQGDPVNVVP